MFALNKSVARNRERPGRRLSFECLENRLLLASEIDVWWGIHQVNIGDAVDFGTVPQGASARTRTFTVFNRGNTVLTLGTISLPEGFRVRPGQGLAATIQAGGHDTFTIELKTDFPGFKYGDLQFNTNDDNEDPYKFVIGGEVTEVSRGAPSIAVECVSCGSEPVRIGSTVDFGTSPGHGCGQLRRFRVFNYGDQDLHLGALQVPDGFRLVGRLSQTIRPGNSDDFMLVMKTNQSGMKSGVVQFTSDAPGAERFEFAVLGEVAQRGQPELDVLLGRDPVRNESLVDFGAAPQGSSARERTFIVVNRGVRTLTLGALEVPDGFRLKEELPSRLRPGARDEFTIEMTTEEVGFRSGIVRFTSNDPNENPYEFTIQGEVFEELVGVPLVPRVEVASYYPSFTNVLDGSTVFFSNTAKTWKFYIYNRGPGELKLGDFNVSGDGYSFLAGPGWSDAVAVNSYRSFQITMRDTAGNAAVHAWINFNSDINTNPFDIWLQRKTN
jgi:hypothetical protein